MKERTQAFSELINRRVKILAEQEPEKWTRLGDIAHQIGLARGRFYHPTRVTRLLTGRAGLLDPPEVAAWIKATGLDKDPQTEAEAWSAAGLLYPGAPVEAVQDLIAAAKGHREIEARTSYEPAAAVGRLIPFPLLRTRAHTPARTAALVSRRAVPKAA